MLVPVRVVVDVYFKKEGEERTWRYFFKDTELPDIVFDKNILVQIQVGDGFENFKVDRNKSPIVFEKITHTILHLDTIVDTKGSLIEQFSSNWVAIEDPLEATDFEKRPVSTKKARKPRAKKVAEESVEK